MCPRILIAALLLLLMSCRQDEAAYLQPSGYAIEAPDRQADFTAYLQDTRQRVAAALAIYYRLDSQYFGEAYPLESVLTMRAPYEISPASHCQQGSGETQGYLLIHGLSDSPYLLSAVAASLHESQPCALIRSVLLPGHGTVPGDALEVQRQQWRDTVDYAVEQFRGAAGQLTLVGYSAGTTLALEYVDRHPAEPLVDALVLLSPAVSLTGLPARLSPYLRWFRRWIDIEPETDAAKYESFPVHAAAEFYLLTRELDWRRLAPLNVPVFMAMSSDDTTVDVAAAAELFCTKAPESKRTLFWLQSDSASGVPAPDCSGVMAVEASSPAHRVLSASHVGISLPADNFHYGMDGSYSQCLHYPPGDVQREQCRQQNGMTVYGERNLLEEGVLEEGQLLRRTTFNPHYKQMLKAMYCLLLAECGR